MESMFSLCIALTSIDVTGFETGNVTDMSSMFNECNNLERIDVSNFNTKKVKFMNTMFNNCGKLTTLNLSSFSTEGILQLDYMFNGCNNLKTIYVSDKWNLGSNVSHENMFTNCSSLVGGAGTAFDASHVDGEYAHIDGGTDNPGYFTDGNIIGDVNHDGSITIADVTALVNIILGKSTCEDTWGDAKLTFNLTRRVDAGYDPISYEFDDEALQTLTSALHLTPAELATVMEQNTTSSMTSGKARLFAVDENGDPICVGETGQPYGYWYNADGIVTTWGSNAKVAITIDQETLSDGKIRLDVFTYSGGSEAGDTYTIKQALRYIDNNGNVGTLWLTYNIVFDATIDESTTELTFAKKHQSVADVNGDGSITIADVTALVNIILGKN